MVDVAVLAALVVVAVGVFLTLAIGWWALRKTLSLVRRLVILGVVAALGLVIMGGLASIYLFG